MRVLYIGSRADDAESLNLEREVTALQRRFGEAVGEPVQFTFIPRLLAEELFATVAKDTVDVLHISAHGSKDQLALSNEVGEEVELSASTLITALEGSREKIPQVVYLNACDSEKIASSLVSIVPIAIGINAPITNRAAREGAAAFYSRLLNGSSVKSAFDAANSSIKMLQNNKVSASLFCHETIKAENEYLHRVPRIIADFATGQPDLEKGGYNFRVGVTGCPSNTIQLLIFTDDKSFVADASGFTGYVVRNSPSRNVLWTDPPQTWWTKGDFRLFATGVTGDGSAFTVSATSICSAVEQKYKLWTARRMTPAMAEALVRLRRNDGAEIDLPSPPRTARGQSVGEARE